MHLGGNRRCMGAPEIYITVVRKSGNYKALQPNRKIPLLTINNPQWFQHSSYL